MLAKPDTARLFFAAWPAPEVQQALGSLARGFEREYGGRAIPARNIHLTLVFLGDVARERLPRLETLAAGVSGARFVLNVDHIEYWRHNRIVWAGITSCPEALPALVERIEQGLSSAGFLSDKRQYSPHITLLRNARSAPLVVSAPAITWPVTRFSLVESAQRERGRVYQVLRDWPLTA